jgi:hypothetical protein
MESRRTLFTSDANVRSVGSHSSSNSAVLWVSQNSAASWTVFNSGILLGALPLAHRTYLSPRWWQVTAIYSSFVCVGVACGHNIIDVAASWREYHGEISATEYLAPMMRYVPSRP